MVYNDTQKMNVFGEIIVYLLSIVVPIGVILITKATGNISEIININIVRICLLFDNTKQAKKMLIEIVTKNPESYNGHKILAMLYEKEGGQRKAVDEYAQVISINPKEYDAYFKVATLLTDLDKKDEAIDTLTNLLNKKPDYPEATIALGDLLIEKKIIRKQQTIIMKH